MQQIDFGWAVSVRRVMLGMGRRELADRAGISYPYLCELENGVKAPGWETMSGLAIALRFARRSDFLRWMEDLTENRPE